MRGSWSCEELMPHFLQLPTVWWTSYALLCDIDCEGSYAANMGGGPTGRGGRDRLLAGRLCRSFTDPAFPRLLSLLHTSVCGFFFPLFAWWVFFPGRKSSPPLSLSLSLFFRLRGGVGELRQTDRQKPRLQLHESAHGLSQEISYLN